MVFKTTRSTRALRPSTIATSVAHLKLSNDYDNKPKPKPKPVKLEKVVKKYPKRPDTHLSPFGYCDLKHKSDKEARLALWTALFEIGFDKTYEKVKFLVEVNQNRPIHKIFQRDLEFLDDVKKTLSGVEGYEFPF